MSTTERTQVGGSRFAIAAGIVGLIVDATYLGIIFEQGDAEVGRIAVVAVFLLVVSLLALAGAFASTPSARTRLTLLGAATGGLLTAGVLGIFSIGLPLLVAGVGVAWHRRDSPERSGPCPRVRRCSPQWPRSGRERSSS
jgi:hypothetical protein